MLTRWLPACENKLPPNASHQVGVGAFVLNERREVLVVQVRGCNWFLKQGLSALGLSMMQLRSWFALSLV